MKKRILTGVFAALVFSAAAVQAAGPFTIEEGYGANYVPGLGEEEWGMLPDVFNGDEPPALPAVQANTIESVKFEEQPALNGGFLFIPPDPHCAVGPNHIITIVNCSIQWYLKTGGAPQNQQPLGKQTAAVTNAFFNSLNPLNATFDPKVLWDQYNNRFVVITLEQVASPQSSRFLLAVSDDADPNGTWYFMAVNSAAIIAGQNCWLDYPGFAIDQNVIYVTGNYFGFSPQTSRGSRLWIVNKAPFYSGGVGTINPNGTPFDHYTLAGVPAGLNGITTMPSHMFGTPPVGVGTFLTGYSGLSDGTNEFILNVRVDNPTGVPVFVTDYPNIPDMGNIDTASGVVPRGTQPGSTAQTATQIDNGDRRCLQSLWTGGNLYATFVVNPPAPSLDAGQCTAHWVKISNPVGPGVVADQGNISGNDVTPAAWTNYPSIAVDKLGNIAIGVGVGSLTTFASQAYTTHNVGDAAGTTYPLTVYANGLSFYKRTFSSATTARNRWGDYSGTVVDPDGCIFWSYHEYAGTQGTPTTVGTVTENGRWWTRAVSYFVDENRNGNADGCEPVAVVLSKFEAVRDGQDALIRWSVAEERDHLGFNVFRETEGGARIMLHAGLLTGKIDYEIRDEDAPEGRATYWLQEVDRSGVSRWIGSIGVEPMSSRPFIAELLGARPNPFQQATTVEFSIGTARDVNLAVYDIQGRKVATLFDGNKDAGSHTVTWDGSTDNGPAASGLYFVKLQTAGLIKNVKVMLTRDSSQN